MGQRMKVLVVDDELPIRDEIRLMGLEKYGYEIVGEATNGKAALELCERLQPDIVITDITMPVMDGLELIRQLQKTKPLIKYILLTCHEDFVYARQALQQGALDYIIKADISAEGIAGVLDRARGIIEKEREQARKLENEKRNGFSRYVMDDAAGDEELERELAKIGFTINPNGPNYFLVMENRLGSWIFVEMTVRGILDAENAVKSWILLDDGFYGISTAGQIDMERLVWCMDGQLREAFDFIGEQFRIYGIESVEVVGSAKRYQGISRKLRDWKAHAFYEPDRAYFPERQIRECSFPGLEHWERLTGVLAGGADEDTLRREVEDFGKEAHLWPEELKKLLISWISGQIGSVGEQLREAERALMNTWDIRQLAAELAAQCGKYGKLSDRSEVRKAIRIVREEYRTELTLAGLAERIGINAQYLGRLFVEDTGEKFSDYVNRIRMERANELLKEGTLKVYEVAEQVGITNYRYFTQKFREWSGISPKEVRKRGK